jgi:hypothetical protein
LNFEIAKANVEAILVSAADGRFRVVGHAGQSRSAAEVKNHNRSVQVYFSRSLFDRGNNRNMTGPYNHDVTLKIELTASSATKMDLSILNDSGATAVQMALALEEYQEASHLADASLDELLGIVWGILMDSRNYDLGFSVGQIANRWIPRFVKDDPLNRGSLVVISGAMDIEFRVSEDVVGDTPVVGGDFDITIDIEGDGVEQTGVSGELGGESYDLVFEGDTLNFGGSNLTFNPTEE